MSAAGSTEPLSATVRAAAAGEMPAWARVSSARLEHLERVVTLLDGWAVRLHLSGTDRQRWSAAGWLHDALRDADPEQLRESLPEPFRAWPRLLLHGPAAAQRLAGEADEEIRDAVRYHTLGHPDLDRLGKALYLADFLEPGRGFSRAWRNELCGRMPGDLDAVLVEVVAARIQHLLDERNPMRPVTVEFWNTLVRQKP